MLDPYPPDVVVASPVYSSTLEPVNVLDPLCIHVPSGCEIVPAGQLTEPKELDDVDEE